MKRLGVGIIGVTPGKSWAALAHIPALQSLCDLYEVVAVSTRSRTRAAAAAAAFGVPNAFDNHDELVRHSAVDLVVVTVRVPSHLELVSAALEAGKHVFCEWPLGRELGEAEHMAALARDRDVHTAVGLQARCAPSINYLRDLIRDGYVGEVLSTSMIGSGIGWGPVVDKASLYSADKIQGATLTSVPFAHAVDALSHVLGEFRQISATRALRRSSVLLAETSETVPMTAEDQVAASGVLESGAVASLHFRGGSTRGGTEFLWEINGTEGDIQVTAPAGLVQMLDLTLKGARGDRRTMELLSVPRKYHHVERKSVLVLNVAEAYWWLAQDIAKGSHGCATFEDAVLRHRMIAAVERAADTGIRQTQPFRTH
jgi:predicted dehydrogenase